jgi:dTDP-glucose 4,6-dehydratase
MNNLPRFRKVLVTGGAGFIGSAFIRYGLKTFGSLEKIVNLDLLTYAASEKNMASFRDDPRHFFVKGDIRDTVLVQSLCDVHQIEAIVHFAAESHVDRSITDPEAFVDTNIVGTCKLLEVIRKNPHIHFHHISTDEVYGSLEEGFFSENTPYRPNSPYSASKAASDHLVRAWAHTYNLSTTLSHCSNNYGPCQHEEKFIPLMITHCLQGKPLPIYGEGINIRDWLYVDDHADAVWRILNHGKKGEVYDIGGKVEKRNIDLLHTLIDLVAKKTSKDTLELQKLITFVEDRPGHDFRYAIDATKITRDLGWQPLHSLDQGLEKTIHWYLS